MKRSTFKVFYRITAPAIMAAIVWVAFIMP